MQYKKLIVNIMVAILLINQAHRLAFYFAPLVILKCNNAIHMFNIYYWMSAVFTGVIIALTKILWIE